MQESSRLQDGQKEKEILMGDEFSMTLLQERFPEYLQTCMLLSPVRPDKGTRKFLNVKCPWERENNLIQQNRKEIKNCVVTHVLEKT